MSFRVRLTLALLGIAAIPLALLGFGIRREVSARFDREAADRVEAAMASVRARLETVLAADQERLRSLARELAADGRVRTAVQSATSAERRWLLDWTSRALETSGFAVLRLQDSAGRDLTSAVALGSANGATRSLASSATLAVRSERFTLVGGSRFDSLDVAGMSPDRAVSAVIVEASDAVPASARLVAPLSLADSDPAASPRMSALMLVPDPRPAAALKASVTRWILIALSGTLLAATLGALLLGRAIAAPVVALAERSARLEREAAIGELARQVNHDVKNGLAPIRNVLRHLVEVAQRDPAALAGVLTERRATLEASIAHLDALARNYAKLAPDVVRTTTDPRPVLLAVAQSTPGVTVDLRMPETLPAIRADAVVLHRILGNLVTNAVEALGGRPGSVTITAEAVDTAPARRVRFTVSDTGQGMSAVELDAALMSYRTSKPGGTGLGLTVVRQLLHEVGGTFEISSTPGVGTTCRAEIPVA